MIGIKKISNLFFYFFLFFLPWQTIYFLREPFFVGEKWHYGVIGIYLSEIFLIVWIFLETILQRKNLKKIFQDNRKLFWLSCFLYFSFLISIFQAKDKWLSVHFYFVIFLGMSLFWLLKNSKLEIKKVVLFFIFSALIQSFLGGYQFFFQTSFSNKYLGLEKHEILQGGTAVIEVGESRFLRAYGGFSHPNIFGGFLFLAFILAFGGFLFLAKNKKENIFYFVSANLIFFGLLSSFSRSAILAFSISNFIIFLYILTRKKELLKKLFFIFSALILIFSFSFFFYQNLFFIRTKIENRLEKKSVNERFLQISQSRFVVQNNFFTGIGLGNYTLFLYEQDLTKPIWQIQPVHNIYLLLLSETGMFTFLLFSFLIFTIFFQFFQKFKNNKFNDLQIIFLIAFLGLLIIGFFDHWIYSFYFGIIIFWIFLGMFFRGRL